MNLYFNFLNLPTKKFENVQLLIVIRTIGGENFPIFQLPNEAESK